LQIENTYYIWTKSGSSQWRIMIQRLLVTYLLVCALLLFDIPSPPLPIIIERLLFLLQLLLFFHFHTYMMLLMTCRVLYQYCNIVFRKLKLIKCILSLFAKLSSVENAETDNLFSPDWYRMCIWYSRMFPNTCFRRWTPVQTKVFKTSDHSTYGFLVWAFKLRFKYQHECRDSMHV